jgi:HEAT repeat protein
MRTTPLLPLALALLLPSVASAQKLSKLSDDELAKLVSDRAADEDDRVEAAELLADHRAVSQAGTMAQACDPADIVNVCEHVLAALEDLEGEAAMAEVERILLITDLDDSMRHKALKILRKLDPYRLDARVPQVLAEYRSLGAGFAVDLLEVLPERKLADWQDITILVATDAGANRRVRVAALDAAESFDHPALYDAWIGLLEDEDKNIRARCAARLGRSGLPSSLVRPALVRVVKTDDAGKVRAAALKSLRFHADPSLLPLLHDEVLGEKHPVAWGHAMELLEPLADASSVPTLCQLLGMQGNLIEEGVIRITHTLVRIGEPSAVPCLEALERASASPAVKLEARAAIDLLAKPEPQRVELISGWSIIELHVAEPGALEPEPFQLGVTLDDDGMAVWATVPTE